MSDQVGTITGYAWRGRPSLAAPGMVMSVSSFETQIEPQESLALLTLANPPAVLISAYDLLRPVKTSRTGKVTPNPKISNTETINELRNSGTIIFLDSGNYEAMRFRDADWQRSKKRLWEAQRLVQVDLAFTHDKMPKETNVMKANSQQRINEISAEFERDSALTDCVLAPIVHAPRIAGNRYCNELLPEICTGVVRAVRPKIIAVAERELGDGIFERVKTIAKIRSALKAQGSNIFLHILGTGNPISSAMLSMAGADFFDGLEWCRTAIDGKRWRLYHFQQWDILASQSGLIQSQPIARLVNNNHGETPWFVRVALHNIAFFLQASQEIRDHHNRDEYEQLFSYKLDLENEYRSILKAIKDCA